jgi:hypothetical protein
MLQYTIMESFSSHLNPFIAQITDTNLVSVTEVRYCDRTRPLPAWAASLGCTALCARKSRRAYLVNERLKASLDKPTIGKRTALIIMEAVGLYAAAAAYEDI